MQPRLKDGRRIDLRDAQVAPDGVLWVSDGHAIYRLLDSGLTGRVLGEAPNALTFDKAAAVTIDRKGLIYAADGRTGALHVFAPDGRWLRVCVPDSGDVKSQLYAPNLTVSDSGDAYLGLDILGSRRFLHFAPDGKRVGIDESKLDEIAEKWFAQPGTSRRWVLGYQRVLLVDEKGAVVRTITRRRRFLARLSRGSRDSARRLNRDRILDRRIPSRKTRARREHLFAARRPNPLVQTASNRRVVSPSNRL